MDEHLHTNGDAVRVYLYGLYMCSSATRYDNTLEHFATTLKLSVDDITSAFLYWQDQGLVNVVSLSPMEIKYLPVKSGSARIKKFTSNKYSDFNAQVQAIIEGRMITPTEYSEYYAFMESMHVEPVALVMIVKYCANLKGNNVGYSYILTVAKNWAYLGIKTVRQVEEKFAVQEYDATLVAKILKDLGSKRNPEPSDYQLLGEWRLKGFDDETLATIASYCNKSSRKKIDDMNELIEKFFKLGLTNPISIDNYIKEKISRDKEIKELLKALGLSREIAGIDRDFYTMWADTRKFTPELINYGATLSLDKGSPMAYLNKVLASWHEKKITTLADAKKSGYSAPAINMTRHSYSAEQLNSLFANIEEVKF